MRVGAWTEENTDSISIYTTMNFKKAHAPRTTWWKIRPQALLMMPHPRNRGQVQVCKNLLVRVAFLDPRHLDGLEFGLVGMMDVILPLRQAGNPIPQVGEADRYRVHLGMGFP